MPRPYVGITGFMSRREAERLLPIMTFYSRHILMVGVLVSSKTAKGIPNRWPGRYPKPEDVSGIFPSHNLALNLIHYNTDTPETLYDELMRLMEIGGLNLNGFQLNIAWPSTETLTKFVLKYPFVQIVLQIGTKAFEAVDNSPEKLAEKLANEYEGLTDYILLDPSGGYGVPFNTERAKEYLLALKARDLTIGLGVAGGLSAKTMNLVKPLLADFPDLSIDAEGRLRDKKDNLSVLAATEYLTRASKLYAAH